MLWEEDTEEVLIEDVFDFGREIPITTWYHFPGTPSERWAVDATDPDAVASSSIAFDFSGNYIEELAKFTLNQLDVINQTD